MSRKPQLPIKRFWKFVEKTDYCWFWSGVTTSEGRTRRAMFSLNGRNMMNAARASWFLFRGDPGKKWVLHICDNPLCVNPDHLYLGTNEDNVQDRMERNPEAGRGEKHWASKLTEKDVIEIMNKYSPRKITLHILADEYGVSYSTISDIIHGRTWLHITNPS